MDRLKTPELRQFGRRRRRRLLWGAAALALIFAVAFVWTDLKPPVDCDEYRFDRAAWLRTEGEISDESTTRYELAQGLETCGTLDGMPRERVRELLGRPLFPDPDWSYPTGVVDDLGDDDYLIIHFDSSGRVVSAEL